MNPQILQPDTLPGMKLINLAVCSLLALSAMAQYEYDYSYGYDFYDNGEALEERGGRLSRKIPVSRTFYPFAPR